MRTVSFETSVPRILATQLLGRFWSDAWRGPMAPVALHDIERGPLQPRHVRLDNTLCGVCASDLHLLFVDLDPRVHPAAMPGADRIYLGHEVVSRVREVGDDVTEMEPGERVLMRSKFLRSTCVSRDLPAPCAGCLDGEYSMCTGPPATPDQIGAGGGWSDGYDAHPAELWAIPDALDDDRAALVEPLACSVRAVLRRMPRPGERALVIGCGTIGLGVIAALRAIAPEAQIFAAARHPQQVAWATARGATIVDGDLIDAAADITGAAVSRAQIPEGLPDAITASFGGRNRTLLGGGFDVVYDCVASDQTLGDALRVTRIGGAVVIVGVNLHLSRVDLTPVLFKHIDLIGAMAHGMENFEGEHLSTFDLTARLILDGRLETEGLITHRFPLERWTEAVATAVDKRTGSIKVMLEVE